MRPAHVDHLVYAGSHLDEGIERIASRLGVAPMPGGRHPGYGTHNALVSLDGGAYLEVIAPDPDAERSDRGFPFAMGEARGWRLATWALRSEAIAPDLSAAVGLGDVEEGRRTRADGVVLTWTLTDPYVMPLDGAVPFLIAWGDTPHPSASAPRAGALRGLRVEHPHPERVRAALEVLDVAVPVHVAEAFALVATIETERGVIELR